MWLQKMCGAWRLLPFQHPPRRAYTDSANCILARADRRTFCVGRTKKPATNNRGVNHS